MNWKAALPLILAVVLGLVAAKLGHELIVRGRATRSDGTKYAKVLVAREDLDVGHAVTDADLATASVSAEQQPRNAFKDASELTGRVLLTGAVKGQPLLDSMLTPRGAGDGPQALVPRGMRAVAVEVTEVSAVGGLLVPGSFVDVLSTLQDDREKEAVTRTIVENVKVLAVGRKLSANDVAAKKGEEQAIPRSVTLIVKPRDAEAIELAASSGRLRLSMRSPLDPTPTKSQGLTVMQLLNRSKSDTWEAFTKALASMPVRPVQATPNVEPVRPVVQPTPQPEQRFVEVIKQGVASHIPMGTQQRKPEEQPVITNTDQSQAFPGRVP